VDTARKIKVPGTESRIIKKITGIMNIVSDLDLGDFLLPLQTYCYEYILL
jgi:hypothetical protein